MKFKVGDRVRVREWDEMEAEFGLDREGDIKCGGGIYFNRLMKGYCGKVLTVQKVDSETHTYKLEESDVWPFCDDMLLPAAKFKVGDKVIGNSKANVRYRFTREGWIGRVVEVGNVSSDPEDGVVVQAVGGGAKFSVSSKCFDLYEGENPSKNPSEGKRRGFKVGDRVRHEKGLATIVYADDTIIPLLLEFDEDIGGHDGDGRTKDGHGWWASEKSIVKADGETKKIVITSDGEKTTARLYEGKVLVKSETARCSPADEYDFGIGAKIAFDRLIESTAEKEEKYYNGKVVCAEQREECFAYTVGKIYEFKNGKLVNDNGFRVPETPIKTLEEWNKGMNADFAKFIPLVE